MKCSWNIPSVYSATLFVALSSCPKIVFGCRASGGPDPLPCCEAERDRIRKLQHLQREVVVGKCDSLVLSITS